MHTRFNGMKLRCVCNSIISSAKLFRPKFGLGITHRLVLCRYLIMHYPSFTDRRHNRIVFKTASIYYHCRRREVTPTPVSHSFRSPANRKKRKKSQPDLNCATAAWRCFSLSNIFHSFMSPPRKHLFIIRFVCLTFSKENKSNHKLSLGKFDKVNYKVDRWYVNILTYVYISGNNTLQLMWKSEWKGHFK